ncbi:MAG: discoidin domain-containing protein [Clostridia bacterium]|nr:discoidin domain-containing protein [Clostridia bacterium]
MKKIAFLFALILLFGITASAALESVSVGKSYTFSATPAASYPDDGKMLTDGVHGQSVNGSYHKSGTYVGIPATTLDENGTFTVTVDLGEVKTDLTGFDLYYTAETDASVYAPEYAEFFTSEDGENYTVAGKIMSGESTQSGILKAGVISSRLKEGVKARYVRFVIKNPNVEPGDANSLVNSGWMFIDEVSVLRDDGKTPETGDTLAVPLFTALGVVSTAGGIGFLTAGMKKRNKK